MHSDATPATAPARAAIPLARPAPVPLDYRQTAPPRRIIAEIVGPPWTLARVSVALGGFALVTLVAGVALAVGFLDLPAGLELPAALTGIAAFFAWGAALPLAFIECADAPPASRRRRQALAALALCAACAAIIMLAILVDRVADPFSD